jgi:hypothetical protein
MAREGQVSRSRANDSSKTDEETKVELYGHGRLSRAFTGMFHGKHQPCDSRRSRRDYKPAVSRMLARKVSTSASVVSNAAIQRTTDWRSSQTWKVQSRCRAAMCRG